MDLIYAFDNFTAIFFSFYIIKEINNWLDLSWQSKIW